MQPGGKLKHIDPPQVFVNDVPMPRPDRDRRVYPCEFVQWALVDLEFDVPDELRGAVEDMLQADEAPEDAENFLHAFKIWNHVEIKLGLTNKITVTNLATGQTHSISGFSLGLINKRDNKPNALHDILAEMAAGRLIPKSKRAGVSKLRKALQAGFDIKANPFVLTEHGYEPTFQIIDAVRNADNSAQARAAHITYTEDFKDEDDAAGALIRNHK
jgi:hypothetical protein